MPLVSVIIPVYNTEIYLMKCINSIINQTLKDIEIIIVNDGSTDNSLAIIHSFSDDRITVINKINGGLSSARNMGIAQAKGEYILHVDSDDWIDENYCLDTVTFAKKHNVDIVLTNLKLLWNDNVVEQKAINPSTSKNIFTSIEYLEYWAKNKAISNCVNRLIKRSLYLNNNITHPENISLGEDLVTTPRLSFYADKIGFIDKSYYNYIQNPLSIMNSSAVYRVYEIINVFNILDDFFIENKLSIDTNYLKAYHYSILISKKYNVLDPYFSKAFDVYIKTMSSIKFDSDFSKHGIKFKLIKIAFKISRSTRMINLIRATNCFFIQSRK
ncbi:glycosyltransferase family 2 protein [Providencia hangzhouensis]|uniref:glycosyltransferase family 2 protein n=1 Tax=Providencia hangzhouensis TaxID=3031799 RepID=UPI0034DD47B4